MATTKKSTTRKPATARAPKPLKTTADRRSGDVVLDYVAGARPGSGVPARDLTGGDLARIVYVRRFNATPRTLGARRARPRPATTEDISKLAGELVATGAFRAAKPKPATKPDQPADTTTTAPAAPASTEDNPPEQPSASDAPDSDAPASEGE